MWYFAWILGIAFAAAFAILNALWFEIQNDQDENRPAPFRQPDT